MSKTAVLTHLFRSSDLGKARHGRLASLVLDVDQDGLDDFVIGARATAPLLVWYRRQAAGWDRHVLEPDLLPIEAGGASHDI